MKKSQITKKVVMEGWVQRGVEVSDFAVTSGAESWLRCYSLWQERGTKEEWGSCNWPPVKFRITVEKL